MPQSYRGWPAALSGDARLPRSSDWIRAESQGQLSLQPFRGRFPAEGACNHRDIVVDHANVRSLIRSRRPHRIRKQLATDRHLPTAVAGPLDNGLDVFLGNARLDKDRFDLALHNQ